MKNSLEEWFYPQAKKVGLALGRDEVDAEWKGRIPILVEDAWDFQQAKIDKLEKENKILEEKAWMYDDLCK